MFLSLLAFVHVGTVHWLAGRYCVKGMIPCRSPQQVRRAFPRKRLGRCVAAGLAEGDACEGREPACLAGLVCRPAAGAAVATCQRPGCHGTT
ncbi:hypothetical protein DIPPA_28892 [Diplonema papillatum]|nr:hypothetical protein DIPPA_28892 [Diplonema papillatum]